MSRNVKRTWCVEGMLSRSGELEGTTGLLWGMWLALPSEPQAQGSLHPLHPVFSHRGTLFWLRVLPQVSTNQAAKHVYPWGN